jgi:hypothetical protein
MEQMARDWDIGIEVASNDCLQSAYWYDGSEALCWSGTLRCSASVDVSVCTLKAWIAKHRN